MVRLPERDVPLAVWLGCWEGPTGNLDWDMSLRLLQLLIELNKSGKTVLIATHDLNLIRAAKQQVPVRVLRIAGGRVQAGGTEL